jgi:glycosyltransferase involved in cell wall biosynthesis
MLSSTHLFDDITLLVTHYNRSSSLERLLRSFRDMGFVFGDIVVSDDGSRKEHLEIVRNLAVDFNFRLITTPLNKGLGNNINKGQDSVVTPFTLYIQEDFVPQPGFLPHLIDGHKIMREDGCWDLISFYAYEQYPYSRPYKLGFSERIFHSSPFYTNNLKFYMYSDHPHLRKSSFLNDIGRYVENKNVDITEMKMSLLFIKKGGRSLLFDDHFSLLIQQNSQTEPSTAAYRNPIMPENSPMAVYKLAKWLYGKYKFLKLNLQLAFR